MAVAVKELIENAIDAKATCITIRFVNFGVEKIEVSDNGAGITPDNFEYLCRRHYTSKLETFEDLDQVSTFGFRGEALASLCNICDMIISTRHKNTEIGTEFMVDQSGEIIPNQKRLLARTVGTTISLRHLFKTLPVRRKELINNSKKAFQQTLHLIHQYAIGMTGIRISCSRKQLAAGVEMNLFTSQGLTVQANLIEIFDYKMFTNLIPIKWDKENLDLESKLTPKANETLESSGFRLEGFISKPDIGCGRSSKDYHFIYLNNRPCEMPDISRNINRIYRLFNRGQYPFVVLKLYLDERLIDRNLTPDKRKVMLCEDHSIFKVVEIVLDSMFNRQETDVHSLSSSQIMNSFLDSSMERAEQSTPKRLNSFNSLNSSNNSDQNENVFNVPTGPPPRKLIRYDPEPSGAKLARYEPEPSGAKLIRYEPEPSGAKLTRYEPEPSGAKEETSKHLEHQNGSSSKTMFEKFFPSLKWTSGRNLSIFDEAKLEDRSSSLSVDEPVNNQVPIVKDQEHSLIEEALPNDFSDALEAFNDNDFAEFCDLEMEGDTQNSSILDEPELQGRDSSTIFFEMEEIELEYMNMFISDQVNIDSQKFIGGIDPENDEDAYQELKMRFSKEDFDNLEVIGQFNLGFIIARTPTNLFIIDQHAVEERRNYEALLSEPKISIQNLVCHMQMSMSSLNEMIVIDNVSTFEKLGFKFSVNNDEKPGRRVKISQIPVGKEWIGSAVDVEEAVAAIRNSPTGQILSKDTSNFVLSGLRREIAYSACRMSIKFGDFLTESLMTTILSRLSSLKNPFHCAHGRPTLRHLIRIPEKNVLAQSTFF